LGSGISKMWTIFDPVRGHVTRTCAVIVLDNENVIKYLVLVTQ